MSIIRIAMRIAIRQALMGKTKVGNNVLDSQIGLVGSDGGELSVNQQKPFISLYAESARVETNEGFRALVQNGVTELTFDVGFSAHHVTTDPDTDEAVVLDGIPASDDNFEFFLDMVIRQIGDALNDPDDPWADIARSFLRRVESIDRACASSGARGVRVALHQLRMRVELLSDPVKGMVVSPQSAIGRFFALAETLDDTTRAKVAEMLAQLQADESSIDAAFRRYGFTHSEAEALLLTMRDGVADDQVITEVISPDQTVLLPEAGP